MKTIKKAGIWMDHAHAHVIEYANPVFTKIVTSKSTHEEKEKTFQEGEKRMHHKNQQEESEYYKEIGKQIREYDDVILFGPTDAKEALFNILKADARFSKIKIEIKQTDKMTEKQEHAFVSDYFQKDRQD